MASNPLYSHDVSSMRPYTREHVSWPPEGSRPTSLSDLLPAADLDWFRAWPSHLLRPPAEAEELLASSPVRRAYRDPVLFRNHATYADFLWRLHSAGMIRWTRARPGQDGELGVFFVSKKQPNKQRLILDTRRVNLRFRKPHGVALPSACAFSNICTHDEDFVIASADIKDFFYRLGVPPSLSDYFSLPRISATSLGLGDLEGRSLGSGEYIIPCLTVLPMGWNWSMVLAQAVTAGALRACGLGGELAILDRRPGVHLKSSANLAAAGYVDNYAIIGKDKNLVDQKLDEVSNYLRQRGLDVHEEERASPHGEFVGLTFDGRRRSVRIKPRRAWRVARAIDEVIS